MAALRGAHGANMTLSPFVSMMKILTMNDYWCCCNILNNNYYYKPITKLLLLMIYYYQVNIPRSLSSRACRICP